MSMAIAKTRSSVGPPDRGIRVRRWTRDEYERAAECGVFRPEERLELLDGEIIEKVSPQNPPHATVLARAARLVAEAFGPGHHARQQMPLILNGQSEPEPDVALVTGTEFDYAASHPTAADTRLVIEVSDTTLRFDRVRKRSAYARAGIREYWIVNLPERVLEVHRDPSGARYGSVTVLDVQGTVTPLAAPHASIRVADLLPPLPPSQAP